MRDLAREVSVPILFGSDQAVIDRVRLQADQPRRSSKHYNAAFQLAPDGTTSAVYRKIHLVPFGEFVPLADWLTVFPPLVQTLAGFAPFSPGDSMVVLPVGRHRASTAICYEVVYPSLVREAVLGGSELLTTITNDAWYGHSSAPFQHFAMASMRAIEHGRYMARAANTGISGVIDPYGRVVAQSAIFEQVGWSRRYDSSPAARCTRRSATSWPIWRWPSSLLALVLHSVSGPRFRRTRRFSLAFDLDDFERRYDELSRRAPSCGGIFEGARLDEQLADIEKHIGAPNFWSNQAEAQKVMQRRRRVDDELTLLQTLKRRSDDLGVLFEWAKAGEDVGRRSPARPRRIPAGD